MLTIRLQRVGKKNRPHFRVVLIDSKRAPKSGAFLEILGWRDPIKKETHLKEDKIKHWLSQGVQTSDTVHNMLASAGIVSEPKKDVHSKKPSKKKAGQDTEAGSEGVSAVEAEKKEEEKSETVAEPQDEKEVKPEKAKTEEQTTVEYEKNEKAKESQPTASTDNKADKEQVKNESATDEEKDIKEKKGD